MYASSSTLEATHRISWLTRLAEALGVVRIVKPRIGMGIEFIDLESPHLEVLRRWVEQLSKSR